MVIGTYCGNAEFFPKSKYVSLIGKYFGNNVSLKRSEQGKGSITIQFSSDAEVESFLKAIEGIN